MEPILKIVAKGYSHRYPNLKDLCFIFPNKRCGIFLKRYFGECGVRQEELPHILTITDFMRQIAGKSEAGKIEQIFTLFNSYKELLKELHKDLKSDFDSFRGWAETVISDFNTVDINLGDTEEIFKNVKDYREITSNFLTEDQKEVMREYFGVEDFQDDNNFWKDFDDPENLSDLKKAFINLWQILAPLHAKFIEALDKKGFGTAGSIFKEAADRLDKRGKYILPYKKIVAVGFNALTESERHIFKKLKQEKGYPGYEDFIDFVWDLDGPILKDTNFNASKFVESNMRIFPSPDWFIEETENDGSDHYPDVEIISSPSNTAQTKVVETILRKYNSEEGKKELTDAQVALIVPDESLLTNILYSLPDELGEINLTMSYNLRQTSISSYMGLIRRVFGTMRENKGSQLFFLKDLKLLFSHPYSSILFGADKLQEVLEYASEFHKISLSLKEISEIIPDFDKNFLFPSKNGEGVEILDFVINICNLLLDKLSVSESEYSDVEDAAQIKIYSEYLIELKEAVLAFAIEASPFSLLHMADRIVAMEKIGFEGEPLTGLQIMGTLETRSLDFKHVIIISMNEGIMPRKAMMSSFIPESLRKAYALPPAHYSEEIFGYYFYRLISRAEKVSLIYDGRSGAGMRGGESRYLLQLRQYMPKSKLKEETWQFNLQNRTSQAKEVVVTEDIERRLQRYLTNGPDRKNLSASSLSTFRECQTKFFYRYLLDLNPDPDRGEYMDSITVGNILHEVMMNLYLPEGKRKVMLEHPETIDKKFLENFLQHPAIISDAVRKAIQKNLYGEKAKNIESGVIDILAEQIEELVKDIITYDMGIAPFTLYGCEISKNLQVKLKSGRMVNFRFAIDRLDRINVNGEERLRIVDYKTGVRKRSADSFEDVFGSSYKVEQIFQLFTYAWLLGKVGVEEYEDVVTEIYFVPDMVKGERGLPVINKKKVQTYREYSDLFSENLENLIEKIFSSEKFMPACNEATCSYCPFNSICH